MAIVPACHVDDVIHAVEQQRIEERRQRERRWWRALPFVIMATVVLDCMVVVSAFDERLILLFIDRPATPGEWRTLRQSENPLLRPDKTVRGRLARRALVNDFRTQVVGARRAALLATWGPSESNPMEWGRNLRNDDVMYLLGSARHCWGVWAVVRFVDDIAVGVDEFCQD